MNYFYNLINNCQGSKKKITKLDFNDNVYNYSLSSPDLDSDSDSDSESDSSVEIIENNNVTQRVEKLETSVSNMEGMLTKMYNFMTSNSSSLSMGYDM